MSRPVAILTNGLYEGLPLGCAVQLARDGYDLALVHRGDTRRGDGTVDELARRIVAALEALGARTHIDRRRLRDAGDFRALVSTVESVLGPPRVLVLGEGSSAYPPRDLLDHDDKAWEAALSIEIDAALGLARACLPGMRDRRDGRIILFTADEPSWDNHLAIHGGHPFGSNSWPFVLGKRARAELASVLARSEHTHGVTVNEIAPSRVRSVSLDELIREDECVDATARDVAHVVSFLCSEAASRVTASTVRILGSPLVFEYEVGADIVP